jgi:hypothetical protein
LAGGIKGANLAHCPSVRSLGYRFRLSIAHPFPNESSLEKRCAPAKASTHQNLGCPGFSHTRLQQCGGKCFNPHPRAGDPNVIFTGILANMFQSTPAREWVPDIP